MHIYLYMLKISLEKMHKKLLTLVGNGEGKPELGIGAGGRFFLYVFPCF